MMHLKTFALCAALVCSTGCLSGPFIDLSGIGRVQPLSEVTIQGSGDAKLVLLEITGVISYEGEGFAFGGQGASTVSRVFEALELAANDKNVVGLILRIRSPGGEVSASETLHHLVKQWKQQTQKPVIAFFQGIATSGGYYVAMAADEVVAHPTAITGSIGVRMSGIEISGLMKKLGIEYPTFTSGAFKDTGTPFRPARDDERELMQGVLDELFSRFVDVVDEGRPGLNRQEVLALADGRIYTAAQALEVGLVDRIGHLDDVVRRANELAQISSSRVIAYRAGGRAVQNLYSKISSTSQRRTDSSLISILAGAIPAGFYYMWPMAMP